MPFVQTKRGKRIWRVRARSGNSYRSNLEYVAGSFGHSKGETRMETRRIGSLEVTVVGLGCNNFGWKLDEELSAAVLESALDAGINFFDTADIYGGTKSEEFVGRALA